MFGLWFSLGVALVLLVIFGGLAAKKQDPIYVLLSVCMASMVIAIAILAMNVRLVAPDSVEPGAYKVACRDGDRVLLLKQLEGNEQRAILVPAENFNGAENVQVCTAVEISVERIATPDGKETYSLQSKPPIPAKNQH